MQHTHQPHDHQHGSGCGHTAVRHAGHIDYLHDGHLHHQEGGTVTEHVIAVSAENPDRCSGGHEAVPHGDHTDYVVDGHLHHVHQDHCDDHGRVDVATRSE